MNYKSMFSTCDLGGRFMDDRLKKVAENVVNHSCKVTKGDNVYIQLVGEWCDLIDLIIQMIYLKGGCPLVNHISNHQIESILNCDNKTLIENALLLWADTDMYAMRKIDCHIEVLNDKMMSDIKSPYLGMFKSIYYQNVHSKARKERTVCGTTTRWVTVRYPSEIIFSHYQGEIDNDWVLDTYSYDYKALSLKMSPLAKCLDNANHIQIISGQTNISFSIKNKKAYICDASVNIPDGEVYICPNKFSASGVLEIKVPTWYAGFQFNYIKLWFENGKVIDFQSDHQEDLSKILNSDEGARYIGEFAFGTNPMIDKYIGNIIFDEKKFGTVHFALGNCLDDDPNGNRSSIHWDLIVELEEDSRVLVDNVVINSSGRFCDENLVGLNPDIKYRKSKLMEINKFPEGGIISGLVGSESVYVNDDMLQIIDLIGDRAYTEKQLYEILAQNNVDEDYIMNIVKQMQELQIIVEKF